MLVEHSQEKLKNAVIYFLKNTKYCGNTKLAKLLYHLDFLHFKETGKSVTGLQYYAYPYGPYPIQNNNISYVMQTSKEGVQFKTITPTEQFNNEYFTKREHTILERVAFFFKETQAQKMVDATHLRKKPWDITRKTKGEKESIDYFLALDADSPPKDKIEEEIADREALNRFFNNER